MQLLSTSIKSSCEQAFRALEANGIKDTRNPNSTMLRVAWKRKTKRRGLYLRILAFNKAMRDLGIQVFFSCLSSVARNFEKLKSLWKRGWENKVNEAQLQFPNWNFSSVTLAIYRWENNCPTVDLEWKLWCISRELLTTKPKIWKDLHCNFILKTDRQGAIEAKCWHVYLPPRVRRKTFFIFWSKRTKSSQIIRNTAFLTKSANNFCKSA